MNVRVAIIGCGSIAETRHAPEYAANTQSQLVAFCDPHLERAEKLAGRFGGKAYADYRDVLRMSDLAAVSVCTSNKTHASISIEALQAGKHVLCEKPMATNLDDAQMMIDVAREAGKVLMIGHNQRLAVGHIKAKAILRSGELGKILSFKTCFGHAGPEMWSADKGSHTWFFKKDTAAFGVMGDLGMHKADLIRWLIDDEIDELSALFSTRDKKNEHNEPIDVEDNAFCILKSRSGIVGNLIASWTYYGPEDNSTVIYCEKGILKIYCHPGYQVQVEMKDCGVTCYRTGEIQTNGHQTESGVIKAFVQSLVTGIKPELSGEEGFEALSIVTAAQESHDKQAFVKVRHVLE
jgi:predicted dehydrogenase